MSMPSRRLRLHAVRPSTEVLEGRQLMAKVVSGVDIDGRRLRKGAGDSIVELVKSEGGSPPPELQVQLDRIGREGGTPLAVSRDNQVLGVVYLKDTIKEGMKARGR